MALYSYKASFFPFQGNPNRTITAIDTSGGIACSRTSGKVPCFIQVSASAITATGTSFPFKDLFYHWDFGDTDSTETFTNPGVGGGTVNSNNGQRGPIAAHVYRTAGTYTITLKMWGKNGSGYTIATKTQEIVVSAFTASEEYWADSNAGGTNAGTEANPFNTIAAINTGIGAGDNISLHVKRGSSFSGAVGLTLWGTVGSGVSSAGMRIDAYGSGALPVFEITSGTASALLLNNGGASSPKPKDDVVVSNIRFATSGTSTGTGVVVTTGGNAEANISNVYFDNCENYQGSDSAASNNISFAGSLSSKIGAWNCVLTGVMGDTNFEHMGYSGGTASWCFILGGSVEGGNLISSPDREHHIYLTVQTQGLYRWINFGQGKNRNYCINVNGFEGDGVVAHNDYHLIADCNGTGTSRFHDASNSTNDPALTLFRNLVCERNKIHDMEAAGAVLFYCAEDYTNRFNHVWNIPGRYFGPDLTALGGILSSEIYGNKFHYASTVGAASIIELGSASWTEVHTITDNIFQDMRTTARCTAFPYAQAVVADRNQYYVPADSNAKAWYDSTTEKSFAEHQTAGFDTNGSVADPGWTDPANGDFS